MTIPYDYDQTNIDHLRAVIDEQEQTIEYLHECCKAEEVVNAKLRELATGLYRCWKGEECEGCPMQDDGGWCVRDIQLRKLGIEVG